MQTIYYNYINLIIYFRMITKQKRKKENKWPYAESNRGPLHVKEVFCH